MTKVDVCVIGGSIQGCGVTQAAASRSDVFCRATGRAVAVRVTAEMLMQKIKKQLPKRVAVADTHVLKLIRAPEVLDSGAPGEVSAE